MSTKVDLSTGRRKISLGDISEDYKDRLTQTVDFILYREIRGSRVTRINRYAYANFIRCNKDLRHFYVRQRATLGLYFYFRNVYFYITGFANSSHKRRDRERQNIHIIFKTLQRIKGNLRPELKMIENDVFIRWVFFKIYEQTS